MSQFDPSHTIPAILGCTILGAILGAGIGMVLSVIGVLILALK